MNRFEKLLNALLAKIESVRALCADIPTDVATKVSEELAHVVKVLRDPQAITTGRNVGYVGALAEEALRDLRSNERRFLITLGTINGLRERIGALHPQTPMKMGVSDAITLYDISRQNHDTGTAVLRTEYDGILFLMEEAETQSRLLRSREADERIRETIANGVVGAIKPAKRGRAAGKRLADAERRSQMKGKTNGGGKNNRKQKTA